MAVSDNNVAETSTSTGTGNLTVVDENGRQSFNSAFGTGGTDVFWYFVSHQSAAEWEVGTGHLSDAATLVRDTVIDGSNGASAVNFSAGTKDVTSDVPYANQFHDRRFLPANLGLAVSAASNALTIALKGADGNDPSATNPVQIPFGSATGTTGTPVVRTIEAANSIVINSGATLGVTSATAFRIWIVAFDDGGTIRLGVRNCSTATRVFSLRDDDIASSTLEGAGSDSAGVFYTAGAGVTDKPFRVLGYAEWSSSGLTAGTWTTTNLSRVRLFGPGVPLPGDTVQTNFTDTGAEFSTSSASFVVATGNTLSITPTCAANALKVTCLGLVVPGASGRVIAAQLSRGTTAATNLFGIVGIFGGAAADLLTQVMVGGFDSPNTTSSTTYAVQVLSDTGGAVTWAGSDGVVFEIVEVMG